MPAAASMRTTPAISSSYATLNASTGSSSIGRIDSYVTGGSGARAASASHSSSRNARSQASPGASISAR